jgi:uncharacterized caspase-like protein
MPTRLFNTNTPSLLQARLHLFCGGALLLLGLLLSWPVQAARLALVIGNDGYRQIEPLKNARNDARLMAATLKEAGFEVGRGGGCATPACACTKQRCSTGQCGTRQTGGVADWQCQLPANALKFPVNDVKLIGSQMQSLGFSTQVVTNANRKTMVRAIENFGREAVDAEVAMIYYTGHGAQLGGKNYLIPLGFNVQTERDLRYEAVPLDQVMESFKGVLKQGILVVDASHSPFGGGTRSIIKGLAEIQPPPKTLVVFSTKPGYTIGESDTGTYSPFARHQALYLKQPGLAIIDIFRETSEAVEKETRGMQVPWIIGTASLGIYLWKHLAP